MSSHPIIMSAESVRAILAGRKTQTRRVMRFNASGRVKAPGALRNWHLDDPLCFLACPYGKPGDTLWVKETWKPHCEGPISEEFPLGTCVKYRADGACVKPTTWTHEQGAWCEMNEESPRWRSPLFMPRWASRVTLQILSVRAERVQDIPEGDAACEGVTCGGCESGEHKPCEPLRSKYAAAWDTLNAKRGFPWASNPWVWVIEFKRVESTTRV